MERTGVALRFGMDKRIDRFIITVRNIESGEMVRQIPAEDMVKLAHSLEDLKGVLYNKTI